MGKGSKAKALSGGGGARGSVGGRGRGGSPSGGPASKRAREEEDDEDDADDDDDMEDEEELPCWKDMNRLRIPELKVLLTARGLAASGNKDALVARLDASRGSGGEEEEEEEEDHEEEGDAGEEEEEALEPMNPGEFQLAMMMPFTKLLDGDESLCTDYRNCSEGALKRVRNPMIGALINNFDDKTKEVAKEALSGPARVGCRVSDVDLEVGRRWHAELLALHARRLLRGGLYFTGGDDDDDNDDDKEKEAEEDEDEAADEDEDEEELPSLKDLNKLRNPELKELLAARGQATSGKKNDLVARLDATGGAARARRGAKAAAKGDPGDVKESKEMRARQKYGVFMTRHEVGPHAVSGVDVDGRVKAALDVETAQLHIRYLRFAPKLTRAEQRAIRAGPNRQHLAVCLHKLFPTFEVAREMQVSIPLAAIRALRVHDSGGPGGAAVVLDLSAPPTFASRRMHCSTRAKNEFRPRSDFTAGKAACATARHGDSCLVENKLSSR